MPEVSVIVPVYNAEKYLAECVESILNQTIQDLELILVDDGSTDSSPAMCDAFAQQDSRVKVIHKPNGRASSARNAGMRAAMGEYIAFVDSDDWIDPDMYEKMLAQGADVCLCDYVRFLGDSQYPFTQANVQGGFYDRDQMILHIFPHLVIDGVEYPITISNWAMLIKRSIVTENKLSYREDILVSEDAPFGSEVLYCANSFAYLKDSYFYHYRMTEGSASKSYKSWWWDSFLRINEETEKFFAGRSDYDFTQQIKSNMFYLARAEIYYIMHDQTLSRQEQNRKIKDVMRHPRVARMMNGYDTKGLRLPFKLLHLAILHQSVSLRRFVEILSKIRERIRS